MRYWVEHDEVRGLARCDRTAVAVADPGDRRGSPRQQRQRVDEREHTGLDQLGERERERRLQAEHPGRGLLERSLLGLGRMRCVVGGDGVDRAVGEPRLHRVDVGVGAQGRVHLEQGVVGRGTPRR